MHEKLSIALQLGRILRIVALSTGACGLPTACSSHSATKPPSAGADAMPYHQNEGNLSLGVNPYIQTASQLETFNADLAAKAVLPLDVRVHNGTEHRVPITPDDFKLTLPNNEVIAPASGSEVAWLAAPKPGLADYATAGVGMLGGLAGPIGAIVGRVAGMAASGFLGWFRTDALQDLSDDYSRKEFKPVALGRNQRVRGFIFFVLPKGTPRFDDATLTFSVTENATETKRLSVPLKGLGYQGLPSTKPQAPESAPEPLTP